MTLLHGCDVSVFQDPRMVDWHQRDFGIVRATYGTSIDKRAVQHVQRIRDAGKIVGLYHFCRADQDSLAQMDAFREVAEAANLGPGDMLPCFDIEDYPGHTISGWDISTLHHIITNIEGHYGGGIIYCTQRDWHRLGKPPWVLERPLWVAHYPCKGATSPLKAPATPGGVPWRLWQWLVGPLGQTLQDHTHKLAVDQDVAVSPLPLIGARTVEVEPEPYEAERAIPYCLLTDEDWDEMREARDRYVREELG